MPFIVLRGSLALVLGAGAAVLVVSCLRGERPAGLAVLGVAELIAAALFVLPRAIRAGGFALLAVLAVAAGLHAASGEPPPISFAVYAAAIWAVMTERKRSAVAS
jgi:hypothetical protein